MQKLEIKRIHEDKRGSVDIITGINSDKECALLSTKAGYARGGCVHTEEEFFTVLDGEVILFVSNDKEENDGKESGWNLKIGDYRKIPANCPHSFIALQDSIVLEAGVKESDKYMKDIEMRKKVDRINNREN